MKGKTSGTLIQGFDLLDTVGHMISTNRKYQATFLSGLESLDIDEDTFNVIRKLYLDSSNGFLRLIIKDIFGDVEV